MPGSAARAILDRSGFALCRAEETRDFAPSNTEATPDAIQAPNSINLARKSKLSTANESQELRRFLSDYFFFVSVTPSTSS